MEGADSTLIVHPVRLLIRQRYKQRLPGLATALVRPLRGSVDRCQRASPSSESLPLTAHAEFDMLGMRYTSVNFGAEESPGPPNW